MRVRDGQRAARWMRAHNPRGRRARARWTRAKPRRSSPAETACAASPRIYFILQMSSRAPRPMKLSLVRFAPSAKPLGCAEKRPGKPPRRDSKRDNEATSEHDDEPQILHVSPNERAAATRRVTQYWRRARATHLVQPHRRRQDSRKAGQRTKQLRFVLARSRLPRPKINMRCCKA